MNIIHIANRYLKSKVIKMLTRLQNKNIADCINQIPQEEYHIMTDEEYIQFHNDRLAELEPWIVEKAVAVLNNPEYNELLKETRKLYKEDPVHWMAPYHFYTGMTIRNLLRDKVCLDDQLTTKEEYKNWDNFYVQILEITAGCREYKRN
jgi:predicted AlkP superfamily phosphohydrolase/phosphomutase